MAMANGDGRWRWPMAMANGDGRWLWLMVLTFELRPSTFDL